LAADVHAHHHERGVVRHIDAHRGHERVLGGLPERTGDRGHGQTAARACRCRAHTAAGNGAAPAKLRTATPARPLSRAGCASRPCGACGGRRAAWGRPWRRPRAGTSPRPSFPSSGPSSAPAAACRRACTSSSGAAVPMLLQRKCCSDVDLALAWGVIAMPLSAASRSSEWMRIVPDFSDVDMKSPALVVLG